MHKSILTLLALWAAHFFVDFQIGIFAVYKTMAGLDLAKAGIIGVIAALIGEGSQAFFGSMSDSGHRKRIIIFGLVFVCASSLMSYTDDYLVLFLLLLATFLGSGAFHPSAAGLVGTLTRTRRGLFFTIFASGGALGLAISQICFYHTYQHLDGNTAVLTIPMLLLIPACYFLPGQLRDKSGATKTSFSAVLKLFKRADLRCLYWVLVCNQGLYWATIFLLPDVLHAMGCEDWISFGGGHLAFIMGGALMLVPAGLLADAYSSKTVIVVSMAASLLFFFLWLGLGITSPWLMLILLAALGAAFNTVAPLGLALGHRLLPGQPGLISAFAMGMVWCVAESLAPASGILTKLFPPEYAPVQTLMVMGLLNVVGLGIAIRLPQDQPEPEAVLA